MTYSDVLVNNVKRVAIVCFCNKWHTDMTYHLLIMDIYAFISIFSVLDDIGQVGNAPEQKPGLCFQCGKAGHCRKVSPGNASYNKIRV